MYSCLQMKCPVSDYRVVWLPKRCYFNDYFEESEECKKRREQMYEGIPFVQAED